MHLFIIDFFFKMYFIHFSTSALLPPLILGPFFPIQASQYASVQRPSVPLRPAKRQFGVQHRHPVADRAAALFPTERSDGLGAQSSAR